MQDDLNAKRARINELSRKLYNIELEVQLMRRRSDRLCCTNTACPSREVPQSQPEDAKTEKA